MSKTLVDLVHTALAIPNSEPAVIVCPDGKQIILCDAGSAAWYKEPLPVVSIRNPWLAYLPVYMIVDYRHAEVLSLSFKDTPATQLEPHLEKTYEFINRHDKVMIHCRMGRSRSAALVVAYLMRTYNDSYDQALARVQGSRPSVHINPGFVEQLKNLQRLAVLPSPK